MILVSAPATSNRIGWPSSVSSGDDVAVRGPELQLDVAGGAKPRQIVVAAREHVDARERLRVAAVEPLGQPDHGREGADGAAQRSGQIAVALVRLLRRRLAMVARQERDDLDLLRVESAQIPILDQIVRMPVMALVADVNADVVEQRAVLEPLAFAVAEPVHAARLIEEAQGEPGDLLRVLGPVAAPLAELDDAAPADVGVALDLPDPRAVAMDVVEDQPFTQRQVAERELFRAQPSQDGVEQNRAGDAEVGAARIEARHVQALFDVGCDQPLAQPVERFGADPPVAQIFGRSRRRR